MARFPTTPFFGDRKTAKTFLAASIFLELLKTFGELDPEVEAKIKYSKWKAADIMKALREGRVPSAGPPGEEDQDSLNDVVPPSISEFPSPPSNFTAPLSSPKPSQDIPIHPPPPVVQAPISAPVPAPVAVVPTIVQPTSQVSDIQTAAAQKYARWAISALDYDDIKTARSQLLSALNEIGFNRENNFGYE